MQSIQPCLWNIGLEIFSKIAFPLRTSVTTWNLMKLCSLVFSTLWLSMLSLTYTDYHPGEPSLHIFLTFSLNIASILFPMCNVVNSFLLAKILSEPCHKLWNYKPRNTFTFCSDVDEDRKLIYPNVIHFE